MDGNQMGKWCAVPGFARENYGSSDVVRGVCFIVAQRMTIT